MIQDNEVMFAKALAHDGTTTVVDLETTKAGPGRPLLVNVQGVNLAGATGLLLKTGTTSTPATDLLEIDISSALLNAGFTFAIPENTSRYVSLDLVGTTTAGTWTAGLQLTGGQTNK